MDRALEETVQEIGGRLDYPMFIVTVEAGRMLAGCLVGFATQCSISPVRFAVWISKNNHTHSVAERAELLTVHVVPEDGEELARLFGEETGDEIDKFDRCSWTRHPSGGILLDGVGEWFCGGIVDRVDGGDHEGFIVEPVAASADDRGFFSFQRARDFEPGHPA